MPIMIKITPSLSSDMTDNSTDESTKNNLAPYDINATLRAEQYLSIMPFSRQGLIEQLGYEGFTTAQAEHEVNSLSY